MCPFASFACAPPISAALTVALSASGTCSASSSTARRLRERRCEPCEARSTDGLSEGSSPEGQVHQHKKSTTPESVVHIYCLQTATRSLPAIKQSWDGKGEQGTQAFSRIGLLYGLCRMNLKTLYQSGNDLSIGFGKDLQNKFAPSFALSQ